LFFFVASIPLFSQEINAEGVGQPDASPPVGDAPQPFSQDDSTLYVIVEYKFDVKGRTRPFMLLYKLIENEEYREGEIITGRTDLEKYINVITQIYINQRVLKDNVEVSYSTGDLNEDGSYPVHIMIKVEDSFNLIALPRPFYKNGAIDITIKARDYNFLGTMNPLRVDLGYGYDEDKRHSFSLGVFMDVPFKALGYYWNITFNNTFQYRVRAPFYYENTTGFSMALPFRSTTFTFGFNEKFYLNQENSDWTPVQTLYGPYQKGLYMSSNPYVAWRIPTGLTLGQFGDLAYTPSVFAIINHEFPRWHLDYFRKGPFLGFSHSLGFGKVDWHGNYREGLSFSLGNSYIYDFHQKIHSVSLDFTGIVHHIFKNYFAASARFMYKYWYSSNNGEGGYVSNYLRGISDNEITAYQMLSINLDLPFRLFAFTPSKWFNSNKFRLFDFELHLAPVMDMAFYHQKYFDGERVMYRHANFAVTGGLELVVYSLFARSLYVRLGFAMDGTEILKTFKIKIPNGRHRELYLIMGHFY